MAESGEAMDFVPMISIEKKANELRDEACGDWIGTEKIHGSSFQFYTKDGTTLQVGSRRRALDNQGSFLKCRIENLLTDYGQNALKVWHIIKTNDKWATYREPFDGYNDDGEENEEDENEDGTTNDSTNTTDNSSQEENEVELRIYGELYGGGGIKKSANSAMQKEIIYSDEFRFYVFGMTINKKWVTIMELNDLCKEAEFPFFAQPVCEPKGSMEELKKFLTDSGFMHTKSSYTDKVDMVKARIEGVVMTPLRRPDFRLHAVKYLSPSFNDVRAEQNCCTKQRYHSVISKLDTDERHNTQMVTDMFVADIIKESPNKNPTQQDQDKWRKACISWLKQDGYLDPPNKIKEPEEKGEEEDFDMGGLFG